MFLESSLDLLSLVSTEDFRMVNRIPRITTIPAITSQFEEGGAMTERTPSDVVPPVPQERRIIVANQLPVRGFRDRCTKKWCFEWDNDALVLQLRDGFSSEIDVLYVGCLKAEVEVSEQEDVAQILLERFRCVPTFLSSEIQNNFYHGFCKHYLWPLFHYLLPFTQSHGARFYRAQWQAYLAANKIFSDKIMEIINPDEDYVWIHDYHLMALPTFLRKRFHRIKLGFFLHSPFPSSEIYRTIPVRDEILKALLNCDLIGFHTFDYARHFLSCCSRILGLDYQLKRGRIGLEYYGRTVCIKIIPVGIHMGQLESVLLLPDMADKVLRLKEQFKERTVILGVDDVDIFKGIGLKFLAMSQLLEEQSQFRGNVVLIQILNPARSQGKDIQEVQNEINLLAEEINKKYGSPGYEPIVLVNGPVSTQEKAAYYTISECCVVNAVRDGMNLVPYKYTVCRQGCPGLDKALEIDESTALRKSVIIVSEFIGCSPSLSGAIRVNPWNIEAVSEAMTLAIKMPDSEKHLRHEKHYKYISSHDVSYWARSLDQELERACGDHFLKRFWGIGLGLNFRVVALDPDFRKLSVDRIVFAYKKTNSRLILLDYDGTMMPQASSDKTPSKEVMSVLNKLCSDPKNTVFIVSGRGRNSLSKWFSLCEKLGIAAEHGYFVRWSKDDSWESPLPVLPTDLEWKKMAEPVMELYTATTDGSFIEHKESAIVWHHQDADPDFGSRQAMELLDHLENVLANEPVVVKRGQHIVEVKPQGISKGVVVGKLISTMRDRGRSPDFVLCIGDDRSDEDMFESIAQSVSNPSLPAIAEVFACTVGQKPSMAKYYLDDTAEVIYSLEGLTKAWIQGPRHAWFF